MVASGVALGRGRARSLAQGRDGGRVARGRRREQVGGRGLRPAGLLREQACRPAVEHGPLGRGHRVAHGGAHQRVDEVQRRARP